MYILSVYYVYNLFVCLLMFDGEESISVEPDAGAWLPVKSTTKSAYLSDILWPNAVRCSRLEIR